MACQHHLAGELSSLIIRGSQSRCTPFYDGVLESSEFGFLAPEPLIHLSTHPLNRPFLLLGLLKDLQSVNLVGPFEQGRFAREAGLTKKDVSYRPTT